MTTELQKAARLIGVAFERFALELAAAVTESSSMSQGGACESCGARRSSLESSLPLLANVEEVAAVLKVTRSQMYHWRQRGYGPPSVRMGKELRYRREDVERWLASTHANVAPEGGA